MSPTKSILATSLAIFTTLVSGSPISSGNVNSAMPFLTAETAYPTSSQVWWTPDASQSQWDWKTWSPSSATSTILAVSTPSATVLVQSTPSATSAVVVTSSSKSEAYSNPFTIYTTMTNSLGVITGMPAVATSQPSQAAKATECSGCASVKSAQSSWSSMISSMYSTSSPVAAAVSPTSSSSASRATSATSTSAGFSQKTNAASRREVLNGGAALAVFGAVAYLL